MRKIIILEVFLILLVSLSLVSAISEAKYKAFLRHELVNYFDNIPTSLTTPELRQAINFYFITGRGRNIDLSKSGLSEKAISIIERRGEEIVAEEREAESAYEESFKISCRERGGGWWPKFKEIGCVTVHSEFNKNDAGDYFDKLCSQKYGKEYLCYNCRTSACIKFREKLGRIVIGFIIKPCPLDSGAELILPPRC